MFTCLQFFVAYFQQMSCLIADPFQNVAEPLYLLVHAYSNENLELLQLLSKIVTLLRVLHIISNKVMGFITLHDARVCCSRSLVMACMGGQWYWYIV